MPRYFLAVVLLTLSVGLVGCAPSYKPGTEPQGLQVVATTGPVGDAVKQVLGEYGTVEVLMGPGDDPHSYREQPSDIRRLDKADVVFYNGMHLEGRMADTLENLGKSRPAFAVTAGLEESEDKRLRYPSDFEGYPDPHVWHDASLWQECVNEIAKQLAEVDPAHAKDYLANAEAYNQQLQELHAYCVTQISTIPKEQRILVTAHDAFGYFAKAYDIEAVGLKGVSTDDEVDLGRMEEVVKLVIDRNVTAVFVESVVAPRIVEAIVEPCQAQGHAVHIGGELYADALGKKDSGADNYVGMIKANVQTIVNGLSGKQSTEADKP